MQAIYQEAEVVTECQYDKVKDYSEGLAAVGKDGNCLIEPVFDWIWEPYGDYVRVEMTVEGKRCEGVIRIKGKVEE